MPTPLSMDLRIRVLAAVAQGLSHRPDSLLSARVLPLAQIFQIFGRQQELSH
jgi:hypothetical protein